VLLGPSVRLVPVNIWNHDSLKSKKERKKETKRARTQNWDDAEWKIIGNSLDKIEIREPYKKPIQTYGTDSSSLLDYSLNFY